MFKSLRWRLQVWHTLVLLVVLTSFGAIVHRLHWQTRMQQVDAELDRTAKAVIFQIRQIRGGRRQRPPRPDLKPETESRPDQNLAAKPALPAPETETNTSPEPTNPAPRDRSFFTPANLTKLLADLDQILRGDDRLPRDDDHVLRGYEESGLYLLIWNDKGELLLKSESAPTIDYPNLKVGENDKPIDIVRERRDGERYREWIHAGPSREARNLLVGRSLQKDLAAHHQSGLLLAVTGLVILAAGTLGGGWVSARAIRPITDMTAAAESISAQNLSERINVKETDSELGKLATVLNGTFDRLQSAFERQQQFTADASHELRTPLSVIATHTELALSRPRSNEDYRAALETCQRASQRMRSLIDALLVLARFDSAAPSLKQERVSLEPLIQDCADLVRSLATARGIEIEVETSPFETVGNWDRLAQVVTNLLTNAIRYNVDHGHVRVTARIEERHAVVSVVDTGIGIAANQLPLIFDRFYQVDKARSRAEGSCGLGLSICKTIVEAHGGTITATSQPDVGTTIEVRLRLAEGPVMPEKSMSDSELLIPVISEHTV